MKKSIKRAVSLLTVLILLIGSIPVSIMAKTGESSNNSGITIDLSKTGESVDEILNNISGLNALANGEEPKKPEVHSEEESNEEYIEDKYVEISPPAENEVDDKLDSATLTESPATDFEYTINNDKVTITDYIGSATEVVIPAEIEGYPVTSIGDEAFRLDRTLTKVIIPETVISIEYGAFFQCELLVNVTLPNGIENIEDRVFSHCESLTNIIIPNSVMHIGNGAFYGCDSLKHVLYRGSENEWSILKGKSNSENDSLFDAVVHYDVQLGTEYKSTVEKSAMCSIGKVEINSCNYCDFSFCVETRENVIGHSFNDRECTRCGLPCDFPLSYIFCNGEIEVYCRKNVTNIIIPAEIEGYPVTCISSQAFWNCTLLTSITIPNSVKSIGDSAFEGCSSLANITIPDSVTSIDSQAFGNCSSLTSITIPDSVTSLGNFVFFGCTSLKELTIGNGVTKMDHLCSDCTALSSIVIGSGVTDIDEAFDDGSLKSITVSENNLNYYSQDGVLFSKDKTILMRYPCAKTGEYTVPESVTIIGDCAFHSCSSLTSITIPDSVTNIGVLAFYGCDSLTSITIPDSVINIGASAFYGCDSLTSITIPNSVISIGTSVFSDCDSLISIKVSDNNTNYSSVEGVLFSKNKTELICCPSGKVGGYVIPDSVIIIHENAFYNCDLLTSITIPDSVIGIGDSAFYGCDSLTSITIPNSVLNVGYGTFSACSQLISIAIGDGLKEIDGSLFAGCGALKKITIGSGVEGIGFDEYLYSLEDIFVSENNEIFSSEDGVLFSKDKTQLIFCPRGKTGRFIIPDSVTNLSNYSFKNSLLSSITIGAGVTEIEGMVFYYAKNLKAISLPKSLTYIGRYEFYYCDNLDHVYYTGTEDEWNNIEIDWQNNDLHDAIIHYEVAQGSEFTLTTKDATCTIGIIGEYSCNHCDSVLVCEEGTPLGHNYIDEICENCGLPEDFQLSYKFNNGEIEITDYKNNITDVVFPPIIEGYPVTSIGADAFYNCYSLTSITIPEGVTSIGDYAFYYCSSLTKITIPESVNSIGAIAFYGCHSLKDVYYTGTEAEWHQIYVYFDNDPLLNATIHFNYVPGAIPEEITPSVDSNVVVDSDKATVSGIKAESKPADVIAQFEGSDNIQIVGKDGNALADDALVGTGSKIQLVENGEVIDEVTVVIKGEIDGNGIIDSDDAIHLLRNTLFPDVFSVVAEDDIDGNGEYNSDDAIYLLRYTLFPEVFPLK